MHQGKDASRPLSNHIHEEFKEFYWFMTLRIDGPLMVYVDGLRKLMRFVWKTLIHIIFKFSSFDK